MYMCKSTWYRRAVPHLSRSSSQGWLHGWGLGVCGETPLWCMWGLCDEVSCRLDTCTTWGPSHVQLSSQHTGGSLEEEWRALWLGAQWACSLYDPTQPHPGIGHAHTPPQQGDGGHHLSSSWSHRCAGWQSLVPSLCVPGSPPVS